jgi:hypothetical protein
VLPTRTLAQRQIVRHEPMSLTLGVYLRGLPAPRCLYRYRDRFRLHPRRDDVASFCRWLRATDEHLTAGLLAYRAKVKCRTHLLNRSGDVIRGELAYQH